MKQFHEKEKYVRSFWNYNKVLISRLHYRNVIRFNSFGNKCDTFLLGIILVEIISIWDPFSEHWIMIGLLKRLWNKENGSGYIFSLSTIIWATTTLWGHGWLKRCRHLLLRAVPFLSAKNIMYFQKRLEKHFLTVTNNCTEKICALKVFVCFLLSGENILCLNECILAVP